MHDAFTKLIGKKCSATLAGETHGSAIFIHIGDRVQRKIPLKNAKLPFSIDTLEAEFVLRVYCSWRLDSENDQVITGSTDKNADINVALQKIIGERINQIRMINNVGDISINFGRYCLWLFCDNYCTDPEKKLLEERNWDIYNRELELLIACDSRYGYIFK